MDKTECIKIFQAAIRHRERMHKEPMTFLLPDGTEFGNGLIDPKADSLYQAMKFAVSYMENQSTK